MTTAPHDIAPFVDEVARRVVATIDAAGQALGVKPGEISLGGGKRIRPRLVFECACALNADMTKAAHLATAVELVHVASLCHDDVIDNAGTRRGAPALNSRVGNQHAVLMGDYLYASASLLVAVELGLDIAHILSDTFLKMTEAELRQSRLVWNPAAEYESYLGVIEGKTAALFVACTRGAAVIAGAPAPMVEAFTAYGRGFGLGFQIVDDVLDYSPKSASWGKEPLKDFTEGLVTLPLIYALRDGNGTGRACVFKHLETRGASSCDATVLDRLVTSSGAIDRCTALAVQFIDDGVAAVAGHVPSDRLAAFARESLARTY